MLYNGTVFIRTCKYVLGGRTMLSTNRRFWKWFFLSFITLGIYGIVFMCLYVRDLNTVCRADGKKTMNYIGMLLLSVITCGIYGMVWTYNLGKRLEQGAVMRGLPPQTSGGSLLCWQIFGSLIVVGPFIAQAKMINALNALCVDYNAKGC